MRGIDTYHGRAVKDLTTNTDGSWSVILEGDVYIVNNNKKFKMPKIPQDVIPQLFFALTILDTNSTTMVLQTKLGDEWRVVLSPTDYQIFDKEHAENGWFPQQPIERQPPDPPPHPDERVADGPTPDEA